MNINDLTGSITVSTFVSYEDGEKCGHSYLGVIKDDKYFDCQEEGNYYEVTSFDDIAYILDSELNEDYATTFEEMDNEVSGVVNKLVNDLKFLAEEEGYDVSRDGYTIDFWKNGEKIYSETVDE